MNVFSGSVTKFYKGVIGPVISLGMILKAVCGLVLEHSIWYVVPTDDNLIV